ncbi:MAG: molybdopterin-dependent oxidoreductase [Nitrososphaerota archaeon]|jgi:anaerobic selenocysteine-containing dehydrogenase|nr:molybdopterin-dependent oxidoreductase [Nitrososphaerota archaeon]MDG6927308.1 molybdopterin-dependent oxidoreductase [Nitrososphaerota archaeon]MDG6930334.1 molybdopterin-dependent oxidoreductase [Nitrososphaerota archaeon]MDG6931690.1 molybdopterin-dependent oxidoreductase [Nitrososphaerota archaeon]MDG6936738.1 molybdopterin-dependent oxidoreductase [Nitrososphaerota archaeon]
MQEAKYINTTCSICGHNQCGVIVKLVDDKVVQIMPNREDPMSKGSICPKSIASVQLLYHPNRLKYPMKRAGPRGSGKWKRVSWDEALGEISEKLLQVKSEYGPEAVVMARGTNRGSWIRLFNRFANSFGTPNWTESGGAQCFTPRSIAQQLTFGGIALEWPDAESSKTIMVWGADPPASWAPKSRKIVNSKSGGSKVIVVDPVMSNMASKADVWLPVRPGSDVALAMGMINVIISEKLYDQEYVEKYTVGFESLKERVAPYTPDKVSEITWVPSDRIIEAARLFATNRPSSIAISATFDEIVDPIQLGRAVSIISAITGNVDVRGGNIFPETAGQIYVDTNDFIMIESLPEDLDKKRLGAQRYPLLSRYLKINFPMAHYPTILDAIITGEPYQIRAMFIMGGNPKLSIANSDRAAEALNKVDFLAVADLFLSKTAEMADIVLPVASWLEYDGLADSAQATYGHLRIRQKVATVGEAQSDTWIMIELAKRMNLKGFWNSEREYLDYILSPTGMTFEQLKGKGGIIYHEPDIGSKLRNGFNTPSKKIELYSERLKGWGYDPLPFYNEPFESPYSTPEVAKQYPLVLTTGRRVSAYFHTAQRNVPALRDIYPDPIVEINNDTAKKLGISDGDKVRVETRRGFVIMKAKLTQGIHPRVVGVQHGWPDIANDNRLTDNTACAVGIGSTTLRGLLCNIRREKQ